MAKKVIITELQIRQIKDMAAMGMTWEAIGRIIGYHHKTLQKREDCAEAYHGGKDAASLRVSQTAYQMATSGRVPDMTKFWLKTQCHWREYDGLKVEIEDNTGGEELVSVIEERLGALGESLRKQLKRHGQTE